MVLKVDLQCRRCYKKVKQVLCKFPQIQDQIYDEKANTVTIKVVCCDPEKMRGKIRCKGGDSIMCIEIIKPPPPPPPPVKPPDPKPSKPPPEKACCKDCCCKDCCHGHRWGPFYFGGPHPPPYYWPYDRSVYVNWGGGGGSTYCYCFEENPQCSV
ncbi:hypothetical protein Goshw_011197, partial [Gossypium schwendimanii]|nr:hypothetical protein [Gossypium schwendimanii]